MNYTQFITQNTKRPTDEQVDNFIDYVSNAHSWYKHLACVGNQDSINIYLNPSAGCRISFDRKSGLTSVSRKEETEKFFHYNEMPTKLYIDKFGFLDFQRTNGTMIYFTEGDLVIDNNRNLSKIYCHDGTYVDIPSDILKATKCTVNSCIHDATDCKWFCYSYKKKVNNAEKLKETNLEIFNIMDKMQQMKFGWSRFYKHLNESEVTVINRHIEEERRKVKSLMKNRIIEIIELSYGQ